MPIEKAEFTPLRRVVWLLALAAIAAAGDGAARASAPPCEYIADIKAVSLPDEVGQPDAIDFTGNDFSTYQINLGLSSALAASYTGRRVLDVGAGLSDFVDVMADRFDADAVAIDVAYAEIDLSGLSTECVDLFHQRRFAMDATRILFPSNYFDLVVSHSLLRWFFLVDPATEEDVRLRIQRGMSIVGQMVRVLDAGGEIRTTDFPDPYGAWFAREHPQLVEAYRAAYRAFLLPYGGQPCSGGDDEDCRLEIDFRYDDEGRGYTVIRKYERLPRGDARGAVSVIRVPRRSRPDRPDRPDATESPDPPEDRDPVDRPHP